jgi:hypothetical protein
LYRLILSYIHKELINQAQYNRANLHIGKTMFRGQSDTDLSVKNFSVGSIINANGDKYLVIATRGQRSVELLDLQTYKHVEGSATVEDINFMSEQELRELVDVSIGRIRQWTFSDFDFDPQGLKN